MSPRLIAFAVFGVVALIVVIMKTDWTTVPPAPTAPGIAPDLDPPPNVQVPIPPEPRVVTNPSRTKLPPPPEAPRADAPVRLPRDPSEDTERDADPDLVRKRDDEEDQVRALRNGGLNTQ